MQLASHAVGPHIACMTQQPASPPLIPEQIPDTFFTHLPGAPTLPRAGQGTSPRHDGSNPRTSNEIKAMVLYDVIIDDILANPGTTLGATAKRLGKADSTISLVVRSDFFKARWLQRRAKYNEDLNFRLQTKMAQVVELSLDKTVETLKARSNIPLPDLTNMNNGLLDRLGYSPNRPGGAGGVNVVVQQNNSSQSESAPVSVSAEGLAKAREYLKVLEASNAASGHRPGNTSRLDESPRSGVGPVVEGEAVRVEGSGEPSST